MKVLYILSSGLIGGAERSVQWYLQSANDGDIEYEVIFLYKGGLIQSEINKAAVPTQILNWSSGYSLLGRLRLIKAIYNIKPDIIHFHDTTPLVKIFIKCFYPHLPILYSCHGINPKSWFNFIGRLIDDRFIKLVICNSYYTLSTYKKVFHRRKNLSVIYLGLELDNYCRDAWSKSIKHPVNQDSDTLDLLYLGGLHEYKGVLDLPVLALELQKLGLQNFRMNIVGNGALYDELKKIIETLGMGERIVLCGSQDNVIPFLNRADILVFPSWWEEPFGLVLLEALACGLSIVAYNSGGVSEAIDNIWGTVIVEKKNVKQMAEAIIDIKQNHKYPAITECKDYLENNFSIKRVVEQTEKVYFELLKSDL